MRSKYGDLEGPENRLEIPVISSAGCLAPAATPTEFDAKLHHYN